MLLSHTINDCLRVSSLKRQTSFKYLQLSDTWREEVFFTTHRKKFVSKMNKIGPHIVDLYTFRHQYPHVEERREVPNLVYDLVQEIRLYGFKVSIISRTKTV